MHSYIGGARDKNVGFAKIEVRGEKLIFNISIRGMYTSASGVYGIYLLVDRKTHEGEQKSTYCLLKISEMNIYNGIGQCNIMVNPEDILDSAYNFYDIEGIAIETENQSYYAIFSLWKDAEVDVNNCLILPKGYKKNMKLDSNVKQKSNADAEKESKVISFPVTSNLHEEEKVAACAQTENQIVNREQPEVAEQKEQKEQKKQKEVEQKEVLTKEEAPQALKDEPEENKEIELETTEIKEFEDLFVNADFVNAFSDDELYDCIEVTPEQIEKAIGAGEAILGNSFLIHGFYNFKHILFGRVADNDRHTKYFIGVPGIYCNRERYMASMFGFVNFKKSHRSDYANPHFGYWYQEI